MPLHIAALENNVVLSKRLIKLNADPAQYGLGKYSGRTALGLAIACKSNAVVQFLQDVEARRASAPKSYTERYLKMQRIVPIEVRYCGQLLSWSRCLKKVCLYACMCLFPCIADR